MKMKTLGVTILSFVFLLTGCTQGKKQTWQYTHKDELTIQDEKGGDVVIPYKETMTIESLGDYVNTGTDTVIYELTDKYFKDNEESKKLLLTNLSNGVKSTYVDENKTAIDIQTFLESKDKSTLKVSIKVQLNKLKDKGAVIRLFGLSQDDFDGDKVSLKIVDSYLKSSGFVKNDNEK